MAKHFSKSEREQIDKQLHQSGLELFDLQGIRGASVAVLCKRIGICKGSFYSFYDSKYDLFLGIAERVQLGIFTEILGFADSFIGTPMEFSGQLFDRTRIAYEESLIMQILGRPGEFEKFMVKVPYERWEEFEKRGLCKYYQRLTKVARDRKLFGDVEPVLLSELISLMGQVVSRRNMIAPKQYDRYIGHLRDLFVLKLAREGNASWL